MGRKKKRKPTCEGASVFFLVTHVPSIVTVVIRLGGSDIQKRRRENLGAKKKKNKVTPLREVCLFFSRDLY